MGDGRADGGMKEGEKEGKPAALPKKWKGAICTNFPYEWVSLRGLPLLSIFFINVAFPSHIIGLTNGRRLKWRLRSFFLLNKECFAKKKKVE